MDTIFKQKDLIEKPSAVFKCEVCQVSLRSMSKLNDHVNYSPLHEKMLNPASETKQDQTILYEGMKLFWRLGETLQVNIFGNHKASKYTIVVLKNEMKEYPSVITADMQKVRNSIAHIRKQKSIGTTANEFLLHRLQATRDGGKMNLELIEMHGDLYPSVTTGNEWNVKEASEMVERKRRPSVQDMDNLRGLFVEEATQLRGARQDAARKSQAVGIAYTAFKELADTIKDNNTFSAKTAWTAAYDKLAHKAKVLQTRAILSGDADLIHQLETTSAAMNAVADNEYQDIDTARSYNN